MLLDQHLTPTQATAAHRERLAAVDAHRHAAGPARPARRERDLAAWLARIGAAVSRRPLADLDARRPELAAVVGEAVGAARDGGVGVRIDLGPGDPAVAHLRLLGRLGAATAGSQIPVSRRRSRSLRRALDRLERGSTECGRSISTAEP